MGRRKGKTLSGCAGLFQAGTDGGMANIGSRRQTMITVEHLTKYYGDFMAVDDLSFEIEEGHVSGFLGPYGAGTSSTR